MRTVRAEVFPVERDRWVAVVDGFDFSTEATSPHEVLDEVRLAVQEVLGWQDVRVELHDEMGRRWQPWHAPEQAARMGVER